MRVNPATASRTWPGSAPVTVMTSRPFSCAAVVRASVRPAWASASVMSAGLTGAAIPAACAASVAAYSIEVLTLDSVTASPRFTPREVSALAIRVTAPASCA